MALLGLVLAAYIAWAGVMSILHTPSVVVTEGGIIPIHKRSAQVAGAIITAAQVGIVLLLTLEVS